MITENEIIETMETVFFDFRQKWIPQELWGYFNWRLPIRDSAKAIMDKIKEGNKPLTLTEFLKRRKDKI